MEGGGGVIIAVLRGGWLLECGNIPCCCPDGLDVVDEFLCELEVEAGVEGFGGGALEVAFGEFDGEGSDAVVVFVDDPDGAGHEWDGIAEDAELGDAGRGHWIIRFG